VANGEVEEMGRVLVACAATLAVAQMGVAMAGTEDLPEFDKLWNYQDPSATEMKFRELEPQAERSGSLDYRLQLQTQIARTLGLQGRFVEAHETLDQVEPALTGETKVARVRYLLERGRALRSSGKLETARPLFLEAWEYGRGQGVDFFAVDAAHMMALVEPPEEKLGWNLRAMELAEATEDGRAKGWLPTLYNNIGWDYHDQGEYAKALESLQKAWDWHQERDRKRGAEEPSRYTRIAKWSVAKQLRMLGRTGEALAMQNELLAEWKAVGEEDGFVHEEVAECLLVLGRSGEAKPHLQKAYVLLKDVSWLVDSEPERIERLENLAGE
jgi:tetratricopeptide (TPR) repeat protein